MPIGAEFEPVRKTICLAVCRSSSNRSPMGRSILRMNQHAAKMFVPWMTVRPRPEEDIQLTNRRFTHRPVRSSGALCYALVHLVLLETQLFSPIPYELHLYTSS